jgi:hypothetical protein
MGLFRPNFIFNPTSTRLFKMFFGCLNLRYFRVALDKSIIRLQPRNGGIIEEKPQTNAILKSFGEVGLSAYEQ